MKNQDWIESLFEYLEAKRDIPFSWGTNDCATFVSGAVEAMTGVYPELPTYTDAKSSLLAIKAISIEDRLTALFGPPIHVGHAQRGDIVIIDQDGRQVLSICTGLECAAPAADGLMYVPKPVDGKAWRV